MSSQLSWSPAAPLNKTVAPLPPAVGEIVPEIVKVEGGLRGGREVHAGDVGIGNRR